MAWSYKQATYNGPVGSDVDVAKAYNGAVTPTSLLICFCWCGTPQTVSSVADTVNGGWTQAAQGSPVTSAAFGRNYHLFYRLNTGAGTPTVTATFSASAGSRGLLIAEYADIATSSAYDVGSGRTQDNPGTGTDAVTSLATGTIAQANSLAVCGLVVNENGTPTKDSDAAWTERVNVSGLSGPATAALEDRNVPTLTTVTGRWTIFAGVSPDTACIVAVFKPLLLATGATGIRQGQGIVETRRVIGY